MPDVARQQQRVRLDQAQRVQRRPPEAHHQRRIEQVDQRPQVVRAVAKLGGARAVVPAVRLARVAEHGVRDEHAAPLDAGARQERVEVAAGLVAAQRDARAVRAQPPGASATNSTLASIGPFPGPSALVRPSILGHRRHARAVSTRAANLVRC